MRQEKRQKDKTGMMLAISFCLMAIVSVFVVSSYVDKLSNDTGISKVADVVKKKAVQDDENSADSIVDSRSGNSSESSGNSSGFAAPLNGEKIMEYSMDMPIYWQTLDQYMTHSGIDIASPAGTDVKACASGTITNIYEDDKFGTVMEINHGNGILSRYGNLASDGLAELGTIVSRGDIIAQVGQSSMFEFDSPEHLHFEMLKGSEPVNPSDYIKGL